MSRFIYSFTAKNRDGQILLEVLIAISLIALGIGLGTILVTSGQGAVADRFQSAKARGLVNESLEAARLILADENKWNTVGDGWHGLDENSNGEWSFSGTEDVHGQLERRVLVNSIDDYRKEITAEVAWDGSSGEELVVNSATFVTNWQDVVEDGGGPDSDDDGLSGDWTNPQTLSTAQVSPSGRKGRAIKIAGDYAYLTTEHGTVGSADLTIFDISDPANPSTAGELDVGSKGLNDVAVSGTRAFGVTFDDENALVVIDVSNPASLSTTTVVNLPSGVEGTSAVAQGSFLYIGREDSDEFLIYNISSPDNPSLEGSLSLAGQVNGLFVRGNRAHLSTDISGDELQIVDINDKANPTVLGSFGADSGGLSVFSARETRVFLGTNNMLHSLNTDPPDSIISYGAKDIGSLVNDLEVVGQFGFLATSDSNDEFQVINVADPNNMTVVSTFNFPQDASALDYKDNHVYVAVRSNDALRIVTSQ